MTTTFPQATGPRRLAVLRHSAVLARRSLAKTTRNPGPAVNGIVTPALFMVLFLSLFGRPVAGTTAGYLQYLFPGILVMGAGLAGMISTGSAINLDLRNGVTDRFRSLPISRTAPLLGSVMADILRYTVAVAVLFGLGALLGFRVRGGVPDALGAAGLAILFGFCLSWVTVYIGVLVRSADAVLAVGFVAFLPLQLGSSLAAPVETLPGWLRAWADVNPVTHVMDACRALLNGTAPAGSVGLTLLWSAALFAVFCPLAVRAYGRQE
ncbi:ABC transporter permease [Actinomadura kijaniata]|uniref:Transport permease protein n=1 Tax=Actinomadura namibiensis TaxID=182080 RepID=A0A7W3QMS5_ACTNM|nr:ABC transporter permease [Actinomadura namibiensis]MBA8952887.1 oleandomycin transport system permease protein [Actinomadura namibiensis]